MRLQTRLLWVVLPGLALAVGVSLGGLSYFSQQSVLRQARQDGQLLARVLGQSIAIGQRVEQGMEQLIGRDLTASATILAQFVAVAEHCRLPAAAITERLGAMVRPDNLAEIWITDAVGKAYLHYGTGALIVR